jgi:hypothetical protein
MTLSFVLLDDRCRTNVRAVRIVSELAQRFALSERVPVLMHLDADRLESRLTVAVEVRRVPKSALLVDEAIDVG